MKYSFSYCVQPRWTTLSIQQPFFFVLLLLSSPWVWAQQSNPLPCSDLGRICTAYIQYLLPSSSSVEDVQNLFNVKPDAITAESSSAYTAKAPYKQSLIVKVQCSCSPEKKYFAYTSYDTTANGTTFDSIVNNAYEGFAWSDHYNATQTFPQNTPVPLSILCGCSNVDWNYLLSHVVTQDDTLLLLAQRFNSDVASIQAVNNVKNDLIYTGVVYFIPINSVDGQVGGPSGPSTNNTPPSKGTSFQGPHGGVSMKIIVGSVVGALLIMVVLVVVYVRSKVLANQRKGSLGDKKSLSKVQNNYTNFIFGSFSTCIGDKSNHERTSMDILIRPSSLRKDLMNNVFDVEKPVVFTYEEVYEATDNFKEERLLGQGGYGSVFLGVLRDQEVAIKRMKATSTKEFLAELNILCKVHHTNLVELIGYCTSEDYLFLVYEYAENRALSDHLHDPVAKGFTPLTWNARVQVALDSARGLEYIHDHTKEHYVHRDVKSNNILLDSNFRAKVADFGLAKLVEKTVDGELPATRVVGTFGYLAPEYLRGGQATSKSDVYAFGVVLFELVTGREAISKSKVMTYSAPERRSIIPIMLAALKDSTPSDINPLQNIVDPSFEAMYPVDSLYKMATLAKQCVEEDPLLRPDMKQIVFTLSQILFSSIEWEATLAGTSQVFSGIFQGR